MRKFILGTAGHVDHGKTALIEALTGTNTDRLPEEKARGISIELGFAPLPLAPDHLACVVDVPGHEKFVRTMVSGATGMDVALLVVAADEGVRLQTAEHVEILRVLGVRRLVCALTKTDLADTSTLEHHRQETRAFLTKRGYANVPILSVCALDGSGLPELRATLLSVSSRNPGLQDEEVLTLPIDRVFTKVGIGTVVTGTLGGSTLRRGERLTLLPSGLQAHARGLEIFGESVEEAPPGCRLAVNLAGIKREAIPAAQTLCRATEIRPTQRIHVALEWMGNLSKPISRRMASHLRLLAGTQDLSVRLLPFKKDSKPEFAEIRLRSPAVLRARERFVLRTESPAASIAGGEVLDPYPSRVSNKEPVAQLRGASAAKRLSLWIQGSVRSVTSEQLAQRISLPLQRTRDLLNQIERTDAFVRFGNNRMVSQARIQQCQEAILRTLRRQSEIPRAELLRIPVLRRDRKLSVFVLDQMLKQNAIQHEGGCLLLPRTADTKPSPCVEQVRRAGLTPPTIDEVAQQSGMKANDVRAELAKGEKQGAVVRLTDRIYCGSDAIQNITSEIHRHFQHQKTLTISEWKTLTGVSRKFAVPLLEYFDRQRVTLCKPDRTRIPGPALRKLTSTSTR